MELVFPVALFVFVILGVVVGVSYWIDRGA